MHARCAVPITPGQLQLAPSSFLLSRPEDALAAPRASFERTSATGDEPRWSARRTLVFVMASNGALWWLIAYALRMMS
jgi:hypothetical protein